MIRLPLEAVDRFESMQASPGTWGTVCSSACALCRGTHCTSPIRVHIRMNKFWRLPNYHLRGSRTGRSIYTSTVVEVVPCQYLRSLRQELLELLLLSGVLDGRGASVGGLRVAGLTLLLEQ